MLQKKGGGATVDWVVKERHSGEETWTNDRSDRSE